MSLSSRRPPLHTVIAIIVALVMLSAFALSGAAMRENIRFARAADQIFDLVSRVRTVAAGQKGFAQNAGEDVWADLERAGQVLPSSTHPNPWGGDLRATTLSNLALRLEEDIPTRDCRRLALYLLGRQPAELGLVSIEAQSVALNIWTPVYPPPAQKAVRKSGDTIESACGNAAYARIGLVFRMR